MLPSCRTFYGSTRMATIFLIWSIGIWCVQRGGGLGVLDLKKMDSRCYPNGSGDLVLTKNTCGTGLSIINMGLSLLIGFLVLITSPMLLSGNPIYHLRTIHD
ncbi:uncharacterized protein LOC113293089 [Papaver somniferum]|uniref:uncharacterized protein LOC113293089 n=1 Tax=Papaver somniferum TaxID=3469 RepID=UPI000E6F622E|nr:uncharacterized protein LOC113293089 [Papaver somniferum]